MRLRSNSIRPARHMLIAGEKLVGVGRPGNREQRQNRNDDQSLHWLTVVPDCGKKRQSLVRFQDEQEKNRGNGLTRRSNPRFRG